MSAVREHGTARGNIMVVDDTPANLRLVEDMLQQRGYEIRLFPRGRLAIAAAGQEPPDLILLDVNMPEMSGHEVCRRLKQDPRLSDIPVIFLTAASTSEEKLECFRAGGVDFIAKPFQMEEVLARVNAHLTVRRLQMEIRDDNLRLQDLVRIHVAKIADAHMATDLQSPGWRKHATATPAGASNGFRFSAAC